MRRLEHIPRVEVIPPGPVQVTVAPRPFLSAYQVKHVPEGLTIRQILHLVGVRFRDGIACTVQIGGQPIPPHLWDRIRPKRAAVLAVNVVPAGGGDDGGSKSGVVRMIVGVILIAVGVFTAQPQLVQAGFMQFASGGFEYLTANSVAPPPMPELGKLSGSGEKSSNTLFLKGARNRAAYFEVIPCVLGRHRHVPPYAMLPYTLEKKEQHMRVLFLIGTGPLAISDLRIGETPIDEFNDVSYEVRFGFEDDPPVTLIQSQVSELDLSIKLEEDEENIRTTETETDEISIDLHWPRGLVHILEDGSYEEIETRIRVQYAAAGTNDWEPAPDQDEIDEGDGVAHVWGETTKPRTRNYQWQVPRGQYDVRVTLLNENAEGDESEADRYLEDVYWIKLRSETKSAPVNKTGVAMVAIDVRATEQLNGVIDEFNCIAHSVLEDYGAWNIRFDGFGEHLKGMFGLQKNDRIEQPNITGAGARTYEFWMLVETDIASTAGVFEDAEGGGGTNEDFGLRLKAKASETWTLDFGSTTIDKVVAGSIDGDWHHWAISYDGTDIRLYFDGVIVGGAHTIALNTVGGRMRIGAFGDSYFRGRIFDFRKWDVCRSGAEILGGKDQLYPGDTPGIISLWPLNEGGGDWCIDHGPRRNHMELMNSPSWIDIEATEDATPTWGLRPTSNPASLFRAILQGPGNGHPVADARLDLTTLADWHGWNKEQGNEFNMVVDFPSTVFERLRAVAAAGLASFTMRDGLYSVVMDKQQSTIVQHFTPRNSWGFTGRKAFVDIPTALKIRFVDEDQDWQQDERTVYDDGYDENSVDNVFEQIELPGITNADQVWRHGRHHIAAAKLRPESYELMVDFEHLVATRGDLVLVSHDVMLVGLGAGRVKSVHLDGSGNVLAIQADEEFTMEEGTTYQVVIRAQDGSAITKTLVTEAGTWRTLRMASPAADNINAGDLFSFGESGSVTSRMIIKAIEPGDDLTARLTLVDEAPAIYTADTGPIPAWSPNITQPPDEQRRPAAPTIKRIVADETVLLRTSDGAFTVRAMLEMSWQSGQFPPPDRMQVQYRVDGGGEEWQSTGWMPIQGRVLYVEGVEEARYYEFRVRSVSRLGQISDWSAYHSAYIIGKTSPPPTVKDFLVTELPGGMRWLTWSTANQPPDFRGVRIRYKAGTTADWSAMTDLGDNLYVTAPLETVRPSGSGQYTFAAKAVDYAGNESAAATFYTVTLSAPPFSDLYMHVDARDLGWPGAITGYGVLVGGKYIESGSAYTWAAAESLGDTWADLEAAAQLWGGGEFTYTHDVIDLERSLTFLPAAWWNVLLHASVQVEERHSADDVTYTSWALAGAEAVTARYIQFRITVTSAPTEADTLTDFRMGIRTATVQEQIIGLDTATLTGDYDLGAGNIRLPITRPYVAITAVMVAFTGNSTGWTWEVADKDVTTGPNVKLRSAGTLTDATIDAIVFGFEE